MKKTIIAIAAFTLLVSACDNKEKEFDATGIFEATEVTVSAEATGRLMAFDISEGKLVEAHQQVGLIDTIQLQLKAQQIGATRESFAEQRPDISAQIAATRQQLSKAELEQKRTADLFADGAATRKQTDDATNAVRVLQGQLKAQISALSNSTRSLNSQVSGAEIQRLQVLDQLKKCHITSPIAGTVLEKYAEQGEFATIASFQSSRHAPYVYKSLHHVTSTGASKVRTTRKSIQQLWQRHAPQLFRHGDVDLAQR